MPSTNVQEMKPEMSMDEVEKYIHDIPDEVLSRFKFSVPWQYSSTTTTNYKDPDGFPAPSSSESKEDYSQTREALQLECWSKFHQNPQVNTAVRGKVGRMTGLGFETTSEIWKLQQIIEQIEEDPRNRLYSFWTKYIGRFEVEGELFLPLSVHTDGFIEVDFTDPSRLGKNGDGGSGIIFHPDKPTMPVLYTICDSGGQKIAQYPSVYVARYPSILNAVSNHKDFSIKLQQKAKSRKHIYRKFNGFYRFMLSWDRGFVTRRAISYLRTTLQWLNHYENLKKYEIDHKKSAGAYLWIFKITNPRDFKIWLSLSDEDKRKTGIEAAKTPGSSLVLPPGMDVEVKNPKLPTIRDEDTDILQMVSSGLNEPQDVMTGTSKGTFASVKASRGPMSDRISDDIAEFERFLRFDFWGTVFFLRNKILGEPLTYKIRKAVGWKKQKPVLKMVPTKVEKLLDFSFPVSEMIDYESRSRALLGVKHGPVSETLGIPNRDVALKLGIGGYGTKRLKKAEEDEKYPELVYAADAESLQERAEAEPSKKVNKIKKRPKGEQNEDD